MEGGGGQSSRSKWNLVSLGALSLANFCGGKAEQILRFCQNKDTHAAGRQANCRGYVISDRYHKICYKNYIQT